MIKGVRCMIKTIEKLIKSIAVFSDDDKYRYSLIRVWENEGKKATVIMLNPSRANELKNDRTVMNLSNYLIDNKYRSMSIVNLYAYMTTYPSELKYRNPEFEKYNDEYIIKAARESDVVIIAWGSDCSKYKARKSEVENMLRPYKNKLKCFKDEQGRKPRHPRDLGEKWVLDDYNFMFIK